MADHSVTKTARSSRPKKPSVVAPTNTATFSATPGAVSAEASAASGIVTGSVTDKSQPPRKVRRIHLTVSRGDAPSTNVTTAATAATITTTSSAPLGNISSFPDYEMDSIRSSETAAHAQSLCAMLAPGFRLASSAEIAETIRELRSSLLLESDPELEMLMIRVLEKLSRMPDANFMSVIGILLDKMETAVSDMVLSCILGSLSRMLRTKAWLHSKDRQNDPASQNSSIAAYRMRRMSLRLIASANYSIRCNCLRLLTDLHFVSKMISSVPVQDANSSHVHAPMMDDEHFAQKVATFIADPDPRVRQTTIGCILDLHERGVPASEALYSVAVAALRDDYEIVRLEAIKLTWTLCSLYPDHPVTANNTSEIIRLVDDGFVKICDMVNDNSKVVRASACGFLGSFTKVDTKFLLQTFSKEVISHLRRKKPLLSNSNGPASTVPVMPTRMAQLANASDLRPASPVSQQQQQMFRVPSAASLSQASKSSSSSVSSLISNVSSDSLSESSSISSAAPALETMPTLASANSQPLQQPSQPMPKYPRGSDRRSANAMNATSTSTTASLPEGDTDVQFEDIRLLDSGAAGAFVHGLEDEFEEVRSSAIDSICELGMHSNEFALSTLDFLVDMFNDEIDSVRINAISSLRKIGSRVKLTLYEEALTVLLSCLEDAQFSVRGSCHQLLRTVQLGNLKCLRLLLDAMKNNLNRYPHDHRSICTVLAAVGRNHGHFVAQVVSDILNTDRRFLSVEQHVEDPHYVASLALILNACDSNREIVPLLPPFIENHYHLFRKKFSDAFPLTDIFQKSKILKFESRNLHFVAGNDQISTGMHTNRCLQMATLLFHQGDHTTALKQLDHTLSELDESIKGQVSGSSRSMVMFSKGYLKLCRAIYILKMTVVRSNTVTESESLIEWIQNQTYQLEHGYLGLSSRARLALAEMRIFSLAMSILLASERCLFNGVISLNDEPTRCEVTFLLRALQQSVADFQILADLEDVSLRSLIDAKIGILKALGNVESDQMVFLSQYIINMTPMMDIFVSGGNNSNMMMSVRECRARILHPVDNIEKPVEFACSVPLHVEIVADFENIPSISEIAIQMELPNRSVTRFWPPISHFRTLRPLHFRLHSTLRIYIPAWSDVCSVRIVPVRRYDVKAASTSKGISENQSGYIEIGSATQLYVRPKSMSEV